MLNHSSMKRITKELERDFKNIDYSLIIYHPNKRFMEVKFPLLNNLLVFRIFPSYPFKPPKLFVNEINYINRHRYMYIQYKPILLELNSREECPCCNTILCDWSPGYTLYQIINEFISKETIYIKVKNYLSFRIVYKQFPFDHLIFHKIISFL